MLLYVVDLRKTNIVIIADLVLCQSHVNTIVVTETMESHRYCV